MPDTNHSVEVSFMRKGKHYRDKCNFILPEGGGWFGIARREMTYGGPEEGGWSYEQNRVFVFLRFCTTPEDVASHVSDMIEQYELSGWGNGGWANHGNNENLGMWRKRPVDVHHESPKYQ